MAAPQPKPRRTPGPIRGTLIIASGQMIGPQPDRITLTVTPPEPPAEAKAWEARLLAIADLADSYERSLGGAGLVLTVNRSEGDRRVLVLASLPAAGWEDRRARTADFLRAAPLGLPVAVELTTY